jgi:UDP-glucuronate decarboxylase
MHPEDGRVVSNFVVQALRGEQLTIYGDGSQTRSFCFVSDLVDGLIRLMNCEPPKGGVRSKGPAALDARGQPAPEDVYGPVNIGNPGEFTMLELASKVSRLVREMTASGELPELPRKSGSKHITNGEAYAKDADGIVFCPLPVDDPKQRRPDITRAKHLLGWEPNWDLEAGLRQMIR